jgi:hypothetical protein
MRPVTGLVVGCSLLLATGLEAQGWSLDFQVGRMRSALDPENPATEQGALSLRFERANTAFRLSTGGPVSLEKPLWGAVALRQRVLIRRKSLFAGFDLSGSGFLIQDGQPRVGVPGLLDPGTVTAPPGGHALAGQAMPVLGFESETIRVVARAGISYYTGAFGGESRSRTVGLADLELWFQPAGGIALSPALRHFRAESERATFASLTAALTLGRMGVWGTVGEWLTAPAGTPVSWATGASLRLHPHLTLTASARRDPLDPLYQTPAHTSWSAGLSIPMARTRAAIRAPVPARYTRGVATIRLPAAEAGRAGRLSIAGDFNGWKAAPMERRGDTWVFTIAVAPGIYHYAFVDPSGKWFVPESVPGRREDGMGGYVAVLVVESAR